jgi:hypothetical protein
MVICSLRSDREERGMCCRIFYIKCGRFKSGGVRFVVSHLSRKDRGEDGAPRVGGRVEDGGVRFLVSHLRREERGEDGAPGVGGGLRVAGLGFWFPTLAAKSAAKMGHPSFEGYVGGSERKVKTSALKSAKTFYT